MHLGRITASLILALAGMAILGDPDVRMVGASCAGFRLLPHALAAAPIVFVGTVIATRDSGATAIVHVDEVWRGRNVPQTAVVHGSAGAETRYFRKGRRYLFAPEATKLTPPYSDNDCTATRPYTASLARYRPRGAHAPHRIRP